MTELPEPYPTQENPHPKISQEEALAIFDTKLEEMLAALIDCANAGVNPFVLQAKLTAKMLEIQNM